MSTLQLTLAAASNTAMTVFTVAAVLVGLAFVLLLIRYANLYVRSLLSRAGIGLLDMVAMSLRKVPPSQIVDAQVMLVQARLDQVDKRDLEAHVLAGGQVGRVVRALIAANRAGIELDFRTAASIDLAGRDVLDAVKTSVTPKVIDCPNPASGKTEIAAVAADGIQVLAKARVTVRTNIARLVGGAGEETIIARVGEGIISTIGSKASHKEVLENPDAISKVVLARGLDAGTAFEIVSIDIADVDIGNNIGARLQADQAEADKRVAQANAEKRRAMAVAAEQEFKAKVMENRAEVVLAEAEIPKAMAEALRAGNLGVMDQYRFRNIQADTSMREGIAGGGDSKPEGLES
ncbi:flotillin-like FloA family protein [Engelhardtia mirabilis]|uniref:Flotillin-like protein FloA n=1 Tax=Engelhardtia mirabilis TaxID=2528011 RepID=A0A518BN89_9BACT|nr:SigmaW regulon antibacterial [Planctomycetes bacterium Pla133]QDV02728.1 SigmaW regulon antibacterial [Planctomycetes bacterium Pla86]